MGRNGKKRDMYAKGGGAKKALVCVLCAAAVPRSEHSATKKGQRERVGLQLTRSQLVHLDLMTSLSSIKGRE